MSDHVPPTREELAEIRRRFDAGGSSRLLRAHVECLLAEAEAAASLRRKVEAWAPVVREALRYQSAPDDDAAELVLEHVLDALRVIPPDLRPEEKP